MQIILKKYRYRKCIYSAKNLDVAEMYKLPLCGDVVFASIHHCLSFFLVHTQSHTHRQSQHTHKHTHTRKCIRTHPKFVNPSEVSQIPKRFRASLCFHLRPSFPWRQWWLTGGPHKALKTIPIHIYIFYSST